MGSQRGTAAIHCASGDHASDGARQASKRMVSRNTVTQGKWSPTSRWYCFGAQLSIDNGNASERVDDRGDADT